MLFTKSLVGLVPGVTPARQKDRLVQGEKSISEILNNHLFDGSARREHSDVHTRSTSCSKERPWKFVYSAHEKEETASAVNVKKLKDTKTKKKNQENKRL